MLIKRFLTYNNYYTNFESRHIREVRCGLDVTATLGWKLRGLWLTSAEFTR